MKRLVWIFAFIAVVCAAPVCRAQGADEKPKDTLVVPFILQENHVIIVVNVNGEPMRALLDTGGAISEVNSKRTAGYKPSDAAPIRIKENGRVEYHNQWAGNLCLADSICRKVTLVSHSGPVLGATVDALVGADFLSQFAQVTVDYEAFTVTFAFHRTQEVLAQK